MDRLGGFSVCQLVCLAGCLPAHLSVYLSVRRSVSRSPCPQAGWLAGRVCNEVCTYTARLRHVVISIISTRAVNTGGERLETGGYKTTIESRGKGSVPPNHSHNYTWHDGGGDWHGRGLVGLGGRDRFSKDLPFRQVSWVAVRQK